MVVVVMMMVSSVMVVVVVRVNLVVMKTVMFMVMTIGSLPFRVFCNG